MQDSAFNALLLPLHLTYGSLELHEVSKIQRSRRFGLEEQRVSDCDES